MSPLLAQSGHWVVHCTCPLLGVKRTWRFAAHMSPFDPKRTGAKLMTNLQGVPDHLIMVHRDYQVHRGGNEAARFHQSCSRFGARMATRGARVAGGQSLADRIYRSRT